MITEIKMLQSDMLHVRGVGPCNWAQFPKGAEVSEDHFFPEASREFRDAVIALFRKGQKKESYDMSIAEQPVVSPQ